MINKVLDLVLSGNHDKSDIKNTNPALRIALYEVTVMISDSIKIPWFSYY